MVVVVVVRVCVVFKNGVVLNGRPEGKRSSATTIITIIPAAVSIRYIGHKRVPKHLLDPINYRLFIIEKV